MDGFIAVVGHTAVVGATKVAFPVHLPVFVHCLSVSTVYCSDVAGNVKVCKTSVR